MKTNRTYTPEFKRQAIHLAQQPGMTASRVARDLGIHNQLLSRRHSEHRSNQELNRPSFTGRGVAALSEQEKQIRDLRRELEIVRRLGQNSTRMGLGRKSVKLS